MMLSATFGLDPPETVADVSGEGGGFIDIQGADDDLQRAANGARNAVHFNFDGNSRALGAIMAEFADQGTSYNSIYVDRLVTRVGVVLNYVADHYRYDEDGDLAEVFEQVAPLVEKFTWASELVEPIVESVVAAVQPVTTTVEPVAAIAHELARRIESLAPIVAEGDSLFRQDTSNAEPVTPAIGDKSTGSLGSHSVYTAPRRPPAQKITPDDPAREEDDGGMIDLTFALDAPVLAGVDVPAGRMRLISDIAGTDGGAAKVDSLVEQIPIEGSSGRSQAFELAVSPGPVSPLGGIEDYTDRFPSVGSSVDPLVRPIFSTGVSRPDTEPAGQPPLRPARKPSSDDRLSPPHAPAEEPAAAAVSSHEPSEDDRDAVDPAVYLQTNRRTALVPMLAVAAAAGRLINRWRHPRDDEQTRLVPPRRRRAESSSS